MAIPCRVNILTPQEFASHTKKFARLINEYGLLDSRIFSKMIDVV